jgi:ribonuclease P protein subunit RPR2
MRQQTAVKQIAKQRIQTLFEQAKEVCKTNPELTLQYIISARKIAMAAKIRLPVEFRRQTCKNCNIVFVHGFNCRVRTQQKREPHIVVTCLNCGNQTRILFREKKLRRIE